MYNCIVIILYYIISKQSIRDKIVSNRKNNIYLDLILRN